MKMKIDVAYIISHGFAARMVLQTDLLGKLKKTGLNVAVITPDATDPNLAEYARKNKIILAEYEPKSTIWGNEYIRIRKYLFEDIRNNPALWEKHLREYYTSKHKSLIRHFKVRFYFILFKFLHTNPKIRKAFQKLELVSLKDKYAKQIIAELNPTLLVATYPVSLAESRLLYAGNQNKDVTTIIHLLSWDNITCKGYFPQLADFYISWGDIMKNELMKSYHINPDKIFNTGVPHFDIHFNMRDTMEYKHLIKEKGLNPELPYLFFAMSSPYFAPYEIEIVEWLSSKIETGVFGEIQLIVRPHPQNVIGDMADTTWIERIKSIVSDRVAVDWPKLSTSRLNWSMQMIDMINFAHLLEGCSLSLNSGSTVTIDTLLHNKAVILTLFDAEHNLSWWQSARRVADYEHLKNVINSKAVTVVNNFDELQNSLIMLIANPNLKNNEQELFLISECGLNNGESTDNVIKVITSFPKNS